MATDNPIVSTASVRFPLEVPDSLCWDWSRGLNELREYRLPGPARVPAPEPKPGPRPRLDPFWGILRLEIIRQRSNRVVIPDELFAQAFWGRAARPRDWRGLLLKRLQRLTPYPITSWKKKDRAPAFFLLEREELRRLATVSERKKQRLAKSTRRQPSNCPPSCCLHPAITHRHLLITLDIAQLGALHTAAVVAQSYSHDGQNIPLARYDFRRTKAQKKGKKSRLAPGDKPRPRRLWSYYLPLLIFGRRAGLTLRQVRLALSCAGEITRSRHSRRPDKAVVLQHKGIELQGPAQAGRWIPCQGNGAQQKTGEGYLLPLRLRRACLGGRRAPSAQQLLNYLKDLVVLENQLGIHTLFRVSNQSRQTPKELLDDTERDLLALRQCPVEIYLPVDYLTRWRSWLEQTCQMVIPDQSKYFKTIKQDPRQKLKHRLKLWARQQKFKRPKLAELLQISTSTLNRFFGTQSTVRPKLLAKIQLLLTQP